MRAPRDTDGKGAIVRAGARGLVGAMAMTGFRTVTASLGKEEETPPAEIVGRHAPASVRRLPVRTQEALTELLHWTYGAGGGMLFGLLPSRFRAHPASGPVYGLATWLAFEAGIAPLLGIPRGRRHQVLWPALIALDHLLYGVVVAGRLAPEPSVHRAKSVRRAKSVQRAKAWAGRTTKRGERWPPGTSPGGLTPSRSTRPAQAVRPRRGTHGRAPLRRRRPFRRSR